MTNKGLAPTKQIIPATAHFYVAVVCKKIGKWGKRTGKKQGAEGKKERKERKGKKERNKGSLSICIGRCEWRCFMERQS
jgi:hypothetical protein